MHEKVVIVTDGPAWPDRRIMRTVEVLRGLDCRIAIIDHGDHPEETRLHYGEDVTYYPMYLPGRGLAGLVWHAANRLTPLSSWKARAKYVTHVLENEKPDIVHCINVFYLEPCARYACDTHAKLVYEPYETWREHIFSSEYNIPQRLAARFAHAEESCSKKSDTIICVSPAQIEYYPDHAKREEVHIVLNTPNNETLVEDISEVHSPLRFVHSGNVVENRQIESFLEGAAEIADMQITVLGNGVYLPQLRNTVRLNGWNKFVDFRSPVSLRELKRTLQSYDVGLIGGSAKNVQTDGALGNKLFDYMSAGLGIVAYRTTALASFPNIEQFAILVDEDDAEALKQVFRELVSNKARVARMKQAALAESEKYTDGKQKEVLCKAYCLLLNAQEADPVSHSSNS
ncbi:MAG: glycosyltransferase [Actinomycetes bacterium]|jgi:glycosyltransferase involved in cell wall biosynthesis|nr:glycosyltransferase [Actinomycetes bacterium]